MTPETWQRVEEIFDAALDMDSGARTAWLDQQCAGDEALRKEVERLLEADRAASSAVSGVVAESVRAFHAAPEGQRIGAYEIISEIGRGGMGVVYLARRDDDVFRKQVAIKVVKRGMDTDQILARFRHERRILARLEHPYIARILDGGSTSDGLPYLVMEHVQGLPVTDYCRQHNLGLGARLDLFAKVCAAVAYAHQNLVVHRDLKPSNILVDESGAPRLLDFGIAKLLDPDTGHGATTLTSEAMRLLTPRYASPEQVMGEPVSTASDIYSLGAILYELLTAAPAHRITGHTPVALVRAICDEEIPPPSVAARNPDTPVPPNKLSGDLDNILLTALRKEPAQRYPSVEGFADDLRRSQEYRPIRARPRTVRYRVGRFVRRNVTAVTAAAILASLLIAGALVMTYEARRAERRFAHLRNLANFFLFDVHDQLESVPGTTAVRESMLRTLLEYLDGVSRESGGDSTLLWEVATAYHRVGDLQGYATRPNLGRREAALESHRKGLRIAQELVEQDPSERNQLLLAGAHQRVGGLLVVTQPDESRRHLQTALAVVEALPSVREGAPDSSRLLLALNGVMAELERSAGNSAESSRRNIMTLEIAQRWFDKHPSESSRDWLATAHWRGSQGYQDVGDFDRAVALARRDIVMREGMLVDHPGKLAHRRGLLNAHEQLASVLSHAGHLSLEDRAAARPEYDIVLTHARALAAADPGDVRARSDLVIALRNACEVKAEDDPRVAAEHAREGLELLPRTPSIGESYLPIFLKCSGVASWKLGNKEAGRDSLQQSADLQQALAAREPQSILARQYLLRTFNLLGALNLEMADRTAALDDHRRALKLAEDLRSQLPNNLLTIRDLADCYERLGRFYETQDWRQAREWHRKNLELWKAWPRSAPPTALDRNRRERAARNVARCDAALGSGAAAQ